MTKKATEKQLRALVHLDRAMRVYSNPSLQEWAMEMGVTTQAARAMRERLVDLGLLGYTRGRSRSTAITLRGRRALNEYRKQNGGEQ